ncbi:hypothetical protein CYMTET_53077 [Cymbomonas tetramitiformis]|uniref:IPT/TIG domain-containing protein n=1 Tax=Cymbomonas tetramitiformis TaxID=36881 RepID=A0AAE0BHQ6_9CHLO|nr:hypothetical protein CYMTET_53077 [Cymbomonas tetramitiformis]
MVLLSDNGWLKSKGGEQLSETRVQKLLIFLKRKACHVTKEPVDFASPFRELFPETPVRLVVPVLMLSLMKMNKRAVGIMHDLAPAQLVDVQAQAETRKMIAKSESAIAGTEILEAEQSLQGDSLKTFLNGTKLRLLIDRGEDIFKDLLNFRCLLLIKLVKVINVYVYSKDNLHGRALEIRKHGLYAYSNTMWCLTAIVAEEIPFFFTQTGRRLVVFLEEYGEYYQMVSKMLGKRSGNINYLDAMCTGEQVRDLQAMEYALGKRGCKDGFKNAPNKEDFAHMHSKTFESCACRRLPTIIFLVGEGSTPSDKKLDGTQKFICVKWCEETQLTEMPYPLERLTPLASFIKEKEVEYLGKIFTTLRWKKYFAALQKCLSASATEVSNLSSPGTQVKEGDILAVKGNFPHDLDLVLYFGDHIMEVELRADRKALSFACPPPQSTRTKVDITIMASFYWGVYANSCMLSKKRQENQEPLYLEEQQVIIRKFPKHVAYSKVCINRVVPTIFSTDGGQAELHGNFATAVHEDIFVTCNGKECTVQSHSLTRLLLMLPSGSEINRPLCVTVKEQSTPTVVSTTMRNMITYKAPMITGFKAEASKLSVSTPLIVTTRGGPTITVYGSNFGEEESILSVRLAETTCTVLHSNHTELEFRVPRGVGYLPTIFASVDGQHPSTQAPVQYSPPTITDTDKRVIAGTSFTLQGLNFGHDSRTVVCLWSTAVQVAIPIQSVSDNSITCSTEGLPLGEGQVSNK